MGLRTAASTVSSDSNAAKIMAPALTEPINHQTKISSPAQASSPRPIISTDVETTTTSSSNPSSTRHTTSTSTINGTVQYTKDKLIDIDKNTSGYQLAFVNHTQTSNGPTNGSSAVTHMDQENIISATTNINSCENAIASTSDSNIASTNVSSDIQPLPSEQHGQQQIAEILQQAIVDLPSETQNGVGNGIQVNASVSTGNTNVNNANAEIDQWGDLDLMQVLKSLESTPVGENLCDLAGGLSLFNDVDVMNIGLDDVVTNTSPPKGVAAQEILAEVEKKRTKMIRECDFMIRRLRKIQSRNMGRHVSEEIYGVYEYAQQMIKRKERETKSISTMTPIGQLQNDKNKINSASSLKVLLKRIDQAANIQQSTGSTLPIGVDHHVNNSNLMAKQAMANVVPALEQHGVDQMQQCAGLLSSELQLVNRTFDSDATASSSGGESADEMITYNNSTQQPLPIARRAAYRWARDRAKIASRWSWLLAQISDLEYRIRQHKELYLLLKKHNGQVELENVSSAAMDTNDSQPSQQSVNGYRGVLPGNTRSDTADTEMKNVESDNGEDNGSARTRPFKWNGFKKRKLLQSTNLHKISRKAARPSTIKCGCRWPVHPCLVCTGRRDPTAPRDLPDMMSTQESVALLDPCFHPILSFPEDVAQSVHIEGILRQPEWQAKAARTSSKAIIRGALAIQKASEREERDRKSLQTQNNSKKLSKKYNNNLVATKLKKARNNNNNRKLKKQFSQLMKNKKKSRKNSNMSGTGNEIGGNHHDNDISSPNGSLSRSKNPSPTPGSSHKYERMYSEKRNKQNAYDIDNIVIPYNIAASHRVEVLSYKEIPTPKWRVIDENTENTEANNQDKAPVEVKPKINNVASTKTGRADEDISNEAFQQRHERALTDERKKFSTFLKFPYSTRSRANRRIDSQADSSGANTPDPMSPAPSTPAQESAPPTPQPADNATEAASDNAQFPLPNSVNNNAINPQPVPIAKAERRRTISLRKVDPREELLRRSNTPDIKDTIPPFEPLEFPIPNDALDKMIESMPESYKEIIDSCINIVSEQANAENKPNQVSALAAVIEESDESEHEEDPNDPEWREPPPRVPRL